MTEQKSSLSSCATGDKGKQLLINAGKRTGSHMYVPWVQINGAHSTSAEDNLVKAVCNAYKGANKPKACSAQGKLGARRHNRCAVGPVEVKLQDRFTVNAGTHYGDPKNGCLSDEQAIQIQGVTGDFCTVSDAVEMCMPSANQCLRLTQLLSFLLLSPQPDSPRASPCRARATSPRA